MLETPVSAAHLKATATATKASVTTVVAWTAPVGRLLEEARVSVVRELKTKQVSERHFFKALRRGGAAGGPRQNVTKRVTYH